MHKLIDADRLLEILEREEEYHSDIPTRADGIRDAIMDVISAPTVDAIPIDWINLFNSTPIGGDSIDDLLREWRYKQEVEAERERDEDENEAD